MGKHTAGGRTMTSYSMQPLPAVAQYARERGGDPVPVIVEAFKPGTGWKRYTWRKRISRSWATKMRAAGYTAVSLDLGATGHADFKLNELLRQPRAAMKVPAR